MTELEISIGGRIFSVACDNEEQEKVKEAAALISEEADSIQAQLGRLPEAKMLLLSALMIADRLVDVESDSKILQEKSEVFSNIKTISNSGNSDLSFFSNIKYLNKLKDINAKACLIKNEFIN